MSWNDFNSADDQSGFDVIPKGTLVKVRMTIKPGGHDDASQGWTGGWATRSNTTGAVYLNCEFVVLEGKYARRKVWSLIGLYSAKGPDWAYSVEKLALISAVFADSVFSLIWEIDCHDGTTSGSSSGAVLRVLS